MELTTRTVPSIPRAGLFERVRRLLQVDPAPRPQRSAPTESSLLHPAAAEAILLAARFLTPEQAAAMSTAYTWRHGHVPTTARRDGSHDPE